MATRILATLFTVLVTACIASTAQAVYFDEDQSLLFQSSNNSPGANWRVANYQEIDSLFGHDMWTTTPSQYQQKIADAIIGLGGYAIGGSISCDTTFGTCEELQSLCEIVTDYPDCASLQITGSEFVMTDLAYDAEMLGGDNPAFGNLYAISGNYSVVEGEWVLNMLSPAASIGDYCENCSFPTIYVSSIPLPPALALMVSALLGLLGLRRFR